MKQFLTAVLLILGLTSALGASQSDEWFKLEPLGGGFSVRLPAKPEEQTKSGDDLTMHLFSLETRYAVYLVSYGDYAPSAHIDVDAELITNRDSFVRSLSAAVINSKKVTKDGHQGLEFTAQNDTTFITCKLYLFGTRIHQISAAVPNGRRDNPDIDRFFSSFTFSGATPTPR
jgi:hypothetical protein